MAGRDYHEKKEGKQKPYKIKHRGRRKEERLLLIVFFKPFLFLSSFPISSNI
jgi:hypothetical protein